MSFELTCPKCGAHSGPSVGICPYCKTLLSSGNSSDSQNNPGLAAIEKYFIEGKLDQALILATNFEKEIIELKKNRDFLLLYSRILIETEAPACKIRAVLNLALLQNPCDQDALDYLLIIDAKLNFTPELNDSGEIELNKLIKRRHDLDLAYFVLGAHLFWVQGDTLSSIRHLDAAVRLRPNFLRAWGCLGSIYKKIGNIPLANNAFEKCLKLETEPSMRKYFQDLISK